MHRRPFLMVRATLEPAVLERFRRWYQDVHLPHMLRIPGIEGGYRACRAKAPTRHIGIFPFASEEAIRGALASPEAQQARQDWLPWMQHVRDLSVEVYVNLTSLPVYSHWN